MRFTKLCIIVAILAIAGTNHAASVDVTTYAELNSAITSISTATDIVVKNDITSAGILGIQGAASITITSDVQGGAILNGNNLAGITLSNGKSLTIDNVSLQGFRRTSTGGAILITGGGNLIITDNNIFSGNSTVNSNGGTISLNSGGGSISIGSNNIFRNNTANGSGSSIFLSATAIQPIIFTMGSGNLFENNTGGYSGQAICTNDAVETGSMTIASGNIFRNNTSGYSGGAIFTRTATSITGSLFQNNQSNGTTAVTSTTGGGAVTSRMNDLILEGNTFTSNAAVNVGGAIDKTEATLTLNQNTFTSNTAPLGGGVFAAQRVGFSASDVILNSGNIFRSNIATDSGGGIYFDGGGTLTINPGNIFEDNSATNDGGGIYIGTGQPRDVGDIGDSGEPIDPLSGPGAPLATPVVIINSQNIFRNNIADGNGGAIYISAEATAIVNGGNTFGGNSAGLGGAIYNAGVLELVSGASGDIDFVGNSAGDGDDIYNTGTINITGDAGRVNIGSGIAGTGDINKTGEGEVVLAVGSINENFTGTYTQTAGTLTNYSTSFFGGVNSISNSNLNLFQTSDLTINNLGLHSANVSSLNSLITTTTVNSSFLSGLNNFHIDLNADNRTADKIIFNGSPASSTLNVASVNIIGAPVDFVIPVQVFEGSAVLGNPNIDFTQTVDQPIRTPIFEYGFRSDGEGQYSLFREELNPQVNRGQVATSAMSNNQVMVNSVIFDHVYIDSEQITYLRNRYAGISMIFAPFQYIRQGGAVWYKPYASFQTLSLSNDTHVDANLYGAVVGVDFETTVLKDGWQFLPTVFAAYNGGQQNFDGVKSYQNGGQGGVMGTFMRGEFISSIMAYAGGYNSEMHVEGYKDEVGNWFAGGAIKSAYNYHPRRNIIVQPNVLAMYNAFGKQKWFSDFGQIAMTNDALNGFAVAPGVNVFYGGETWSCYGTIAYYFNFNNATGGTADGYNLDKVHMKYGFLEYGVGFIKNFGERFLGYSQVTLFNGGRTGVGLQAGLAIRF